MIYQCVSNWYKNRMTQLPELFTNINTGVYIIGVSDGGERHHAFTAAWVMKVSFNPPMPAISINPYNYSYQLLQAARICTVNVLGQNQLAIAGHFGRNDIADKMTGFVWQQDGTGAPILAVPAWDGGNANCS